MLHFIPIIIGAYFLIFGPLPTDIAYFNQILGLALIVAGPWITKKLF